jgi:hypothetical protein
MISPVGQVSEHPPLTQAVPGPQALPQRPQFRLSLTRSVQIVPPLGPGQAFSPETQEIWQLPATHAYPVGHAWPQAPQLLLSRDSSTQAPLQLVSPA